MPTKRQRRTRNAIEGVTPTEWYWLTGEGRGDELNEFELEFDLRSPLHYRQVSRCLELLRAYPQHANRNHPGRIEALEAELERLEQAAAYRNAMKSEKE